MRRRSTTYSSTSSRRRRPPLLGHPDLRRAQRPAGSQTVDQFDDPVRPAGPAPEDVVAVDPQATRPVLYGQGRPPDDRFSVRHHRDVPWKRWNASSTESWRGWSGSRGPGDDLGPGACWEPIHAAQGSDRVRRRRCTPEYAPAAKRRGQPAARGRDHEPRGDMGVEPDDRADDQGQQDAVPEARRGASRPRARPRRWPPRRRRSTARRSSCPSRRPVVLADAMRIGSRPSFCAVIFWRLPKRTLLDVSEPVSATPSQPSSVPKIG